MGPRDADITITSESKPLPDVPAPSGVTPVVLGIEVVVAVAGPVVDCVCMHDGRWVGQ